MAPAHPPLLEQECQSQPPADLEDDRAHDPHDRDQRHRLDEVREGPGQDVLEVPEADERHPEEAGQVDVVEGVPDAGEGRIDLE